MIIIGNALKKKESVKCAYCGNEIHDEYVMVGDNYLQAKYFEEQDGSDNIFCDSGCLAAALSYQSISKEDEEWPSENSENDEEKDVEDSENT